MRLEYLFNADELMEILDAIKMHFILRYQYSCSQFPNTRKFIRILAIIKLKYIFVVALNILLAKIE